MTIEVFMRDGRTVHRLRRRGDLIELIRRKPAELDQLRPVPTETKWHVDGEFVPSRLMFLAPAAISQVVQVQPSEEAPRHV